MGDLPDPGDPVSVDLPRPATAVAVGAHPDDIEFGAGATLARWAAAGTRLHHVVLTDGSKGTWDPGASLDQLVAARRAEAVAAAAVVDHGGGKAAAAPADADRVVFLDQVDGELEDGPGPRRALAAVLRRLRPDVVLAHDPWRRYRLHPDHRAAGFLTLAAVVAARDPHFFPDLGLDPHRPQAVLLWEADQANHVERADDASVATKVAALLCHASQYRSTMGIDPEPSAAEAGATDHPVAAFEAKVRRQLASHGALAGVPVGEAFHLLTDV